MSLISRFHKTPGNDTLTINPDDLQRNKISGGAGTDTLILNGNFKEWDIEFVYDNNDKLDYFLVSDEGYAQRGASRIQTDYTDWATLSEFEVIKFKDKIVDLTAKNKPTPTDNNSVDIMGNSVTLCSNIKSNEFYAFGFHNNALNSFAFSTLDLDDEDDYISMIGSGQHGHDSFDGSKINTYGGNDKIKILANGKAIVASELDLGSGDDTVDVTALHIEQPSAGALKLTPTYYNSKVDLGSGNDWINIAIFGVRSSFNGGSGIDTLVLSGNKSEYLLKEVGSPNEEGFHLQAHRDSVFTHLKDLAQISESVKLNEGIKAYNFETIVFDDGIIDYKTSEKVGGDPTEVIDVPTKFKVKNIHKIIGFNPSTDTL